MFVQKAGVFWITMFGFEIFGVSQWHEGRIRQWHDETYLEFKKI